MRIEHLDSNEEKRRWSRDLSMLSIISQFVELWANVFQNCELGFPASSRDAITFFKDKIDHGVSK